jgi:CBS domain-containing protein
MNAGEICNREVVVAYRNMNLAEAAKLMREYHVGSLVVCVDRLSERVPVGMLTDRALTVAVIAKELTRTRLMSAK